MQYLSTRGRAPAAQFEDVLLAGLAPDGGLYMPESWPQLSADEIAAFCDAPYPLVAAEIMARFTGDAFDEDVLLEMAGDVYAEFDADAVAPLTQIGSQDYILELFHGPTLAFKDFAMQLLGRLFDEALARRDERLTIIAATSGDTGAAAIDALKDCARVNVVVLHPKGRVTDVQRRMMTCVSHPNVSNIAVEGSFDDCQAIVKTLFADRAFVEKVCLSGVNSINWARLAAQIVYYFTAASSIGAEAPINFVVPTGNFGDVFAGYAAKRMGLNVGKLGVATNANDILHRALSMGDYSPAKVSPTSSPSMDIQVASNFERLLFEAMDRDAAALAARMEDFAKARAMQIDEGVRARMREDFISGVANEEQTLAEIKRHYESTGALIDPHTAVARVALLQMRAEGALEGPCVTLSTAHPAKFPDAVEQAVGVRPSLPERFADLFERREYMTDSPADSEAVKEIMLARAGPSAQQ